MKKLAVHKLDVSSSISNLLLVLGIVVASAPVLLGDQLVVIVSDVIRHASMLLQEVSLSLQRLLS